MHPGRLTSSLPGVWGRIVPALISAVFLVAGASLVALLFAISEEVPFARLGGWVCIGYLLWHYGKRLWGDYALVRVRKAAEAAAHNLELMRREVDSGCYDGCELARRLRFMEEEPRASFSVAPCTLIYPLLEGRDAEPRKTELPQEESDSDEGGCGDDDVWDPESDLS